MFKKVGNALKIGIAEIFKRDGDSVYSSGASLYHIKDSSRCDHSVTKNNIAQFTIVAKLQISICDGELAGNDFDSFSGLDGVVRFCPRVVVNGAGG